MSCSICLSKFQNRAEIDCKHAFCRKCIVKWSKTNTTCPMCRANFTEIKTEKSTTIVEPVQEEIEFSTVLIEYLQNDRFKLILASEYLSESPDLTTVLVCRQLYRVFHNERVVNDLLHMGVARPLIDNATQCLRAMFQAS